MMGFFVADSQIRRSLFTFTSTRRTSRDWTPQSRFARTFARRSGRSTTTGSKGLSSPDTARQTRPQYGYGYGYGYDQSYAMYGQQYYGYNYAQYPQGAQQYAQGTQQQYAQGTQQQYQQGAQQYDAQQYQQGAQQYDAQQYQQYYAQGGYTQDTTSQTVSG